MTKLFVGQPRLHRVCWSITVGWVTNPLFLIKSNLALIQDLNQALRIRLEWSLETIYFSTHQFELIHRKLTKKTICSKVSHVRTSNTRFSAKCFIIFVEGLWKLHFLSFQFFSTKIYWFGQHIPFSTESRLNWV